MWRLLGHPTFEVNQALFNLLTGWSDAVQNRREPGFQPCLLLVASIKSPLLRVEDNTCHV